MKYTGQLVTGDFEDNTMTFEIDGEMILQAGKYSIEQIQVGNQVKNLGIADVSNRRELYFAFMKEYNALMGESEHQILKEEVEVLLAKYSC